MVTPLVLAAVTLVNAASFQASEVKAMKVLTLSKNIAASQDEAYAAWSSADALKSWMAHDVLMEPEVNGYFRVHFAQRGDQYIGTGDLTMLSLEAPTRIMFTWDAPVEYPYVRGQRTVVELRFEGVSDNQTKVTLRQFGWGDGEEWDATFEYFGGAWAYVLGKMEAHFAEGD